MRQMKAMSSAYHTIQDPDKPFLPDITASNIGFTATIGSTDGDHTSFPATTKYNQPMRDKDKKDFFKLGLHPNVDYNQQE